MLLDTILPDYDVREYHARDVHAPVAQVYAVLRGADIGASPIVRGLFMLRGLALLLQPHAGRPRRQPLTLEDFLQTGFVLLGERPDEELVLGLIGRFWTPGGGIHRIPAAQFQAFAEPGYAKAVWNFAPRPSAHEAVHLSTETRVQCLDAASRRRFRRYWTLIGPWSGLIRREMLRTISRAAEQP
jgi:hypothetical protein